MGGASRARKSVIFWILNLIVNLENEERKKLISLLDERNQLLLDRERDLADRSEELAAQKEELTAAIEEVIEKNAYLSETLKKLQQRNQELDQILYRASHDLKSPVTSMVGLVDLLKGEGLTHSQRIICDHLSNKTAQMMSLLTSLNMLAQAAFDSIQSRPVSISGVALRAVKDLSDHPNFARSRFRLAIPNDLKYSGDELKLGITLRCLLENALTFSTEIESPIFISAKIETQRLLILVEDEGEGISPSLKEKIFEMFYRGSERSTGAGLGLYIVKSIVDRLNGSVAVDSEAGKTTFTVALPVPDSDSVVQAL